MSAFLAGKKAGGPENDFSGVTPEKSGDARRRREQWFGEDGQAFLRE
jgi:hypothetical protein